MIFESLIFIFIFIISSLLPSELHSFQVRHRTQPFISTYCARSLQISSRARGVMSVRVADDDVLYTDAKQIRRGSRAVTSPDSCPSLIAHAVRSPTVTVTHRSTTARTSTQPRRRRGCKGGRARRWFVLARSPFCENNSDLQIA